MSRIGPIRYTRRYTALQAGAGPYRNGRAKAVSLPSIHNLQNRLMTGSGGCRVQKIAHRGDRLPIASDDFTNVRSPHFYLEQDLSALLNLRYQHFIGCFDQVLYHELQEILHKTDQAWAAASFLRVFRIMLATVSLGWAPFFTQ
jgi:hypothetical protein